MHTHLEQWAADAAVPGEQFWGVRCLAQGSHLSRGQFLLEPRFEPTTSSYKSDAQSTRAMTVCVRERIERVAESEFVLSFSPFLFLFCSNVLRR